MDKARHEVDGSNTAPPINYERRCVVGKPDAAAAAKVLGTVHQRSQHYEEFQLRDIWVPHWR